MSLTRSVAYNTVIQIIGKAVGLLFSFSTIAILTRYFGVNGYGQFMTAFAFVGFFAVFADFGFFTTMVKELSVEKYSFREIANNVLTFRTVIAILIFLIAVLVAQLVPNYDPLVKKGIILAALAIFFMTINQTLVGIFQAKFRMDKGIIGDIISRLVILALIIFAVKYQVSLIGVLWIYAIGNFCAILTSFLFSRRYVKLWPAFNFSIWKYIFHNSWSLGIIIVLGLIYFRNDMLVLSFIKSSKDVGIYGASYKLFDLLITIPSMFLAASFPALARFTAEKDARLEKLFKKSYEFLVMMSVPIMFGGIYFSSKIIYLIAGNEFLTASTISVFDIPITAVIAFQILLFTLIFVFFTGLLNNAIITANIQKKLIIPNICFVAFNLGLNILLIPKYSYFAAAITTFLTELLVFSTSVFIVTKVLKYSFKPLIIIVKTLFASVVMILVAKLLHSINFLFILPIIGAIYLIILYLIGALRKDVIQEIVGRGDA